MDEIDEIIKLSIGVEIVPAYTAEDLGADEFYSRIDGSVEERVFLVRESARETVRRALITYAGVIAAASRPKAAA